MSKSSASIYAVTPVSADDDLSDTSLDGGLEPGTPQPPQKEKTRTVITYLRKAFVVLRPGWLSSVRENITVAEFSGAFGDLGTFIPLTVALAEAGCIDFAAVLLYSGVLNLFTVLLFDLPIPVQPMKTIAAAALVQKLPYEEIVASGILTGAIVFGLTILNLVHTVSKFTPPSITRGIQLGIGLDLVKKACGKDMAYVQVPNADGTLSTIWFGWNSVLSSVVLLVMCQLFMGVDRVPIALIAFVYGLIIAVATHPEVLSELSWGISLPAPILPSKEAFGHAFFTLALPQLPMTLLNSMVAVEALAAELFPGKDCGVQRLGYSIAFANFGFCWFGGLPSCHGCGGLASQYAFGARHSVSMMFLGLSKIIVAVLFGSSFMYILRVGVYPGSVLGVLVAVSGIQLGCLALRSVDGKDSEALFVMMAVAGVTMALNTGVAFVVGVVCAGVFYLRTYVIDLVKRRSVQSPTTPA